MKTIENIKQASEFLGIPESEIFDFFRIDNENWKYRDINGYCCLYRKINENWIKITEYICSYGNGDWEYKDKNGYYHLFRKINENWVELTKDINAGSIFSFKNGNWCYKDEKGNGYLFGKNNKLIRKY